MERLTKEKFIIKAKSIYGEKYDYTKVEYKNSKTKIIVICPEHGEFLAIPNNFLQGHACPTCGGRQRRTKDVFIERSLKKHANRYDYSKIEYRGADEPICIICPIHGEFWQKPSVHMNGHGCQMCFATPKASTYDFIEKAKSIYGDKYDYSKVDYQGNKIKVCIICHQHGEWWVTPNNFLRGSQCPKCYGTPKHTNEEFIEKAIDVHGNKYDYSRVKYDGLKKEVEIICRLHGSFNQKPFVNLHGYGCPSCSGREHIDRDVFIRRSLETHITKYDYSKVVFNNSMEKVCIICPIHGEFLQTAYYHMQGGNCPKCVGGRKLTTEDFIEKAQQVHKQKYDYSKVDYKGYSRKVCIICLEHGEFWQTPNGHLFGAGCPTCSESNLEGAVRQFLFKNNIAFEQEKGFEWLKYRKKLFLDFYLPEYGVAIECQGKQHFTPIDMFGGEEFFYKTLQRDQVKKELCEKHDIRIIYFSNACIDYPYEVIETYTDLLQEIIKYPQNTI